MKEDKHGHTSVRVRGSSSSSFHFWSYGVKGKDSATSQSSFSCCHSPTTQPDEELRKAYRDIGMDILFLPSSLGYSALPPPWALVFDQTVPSPQWSLWPSALCDRKEGNLWLPRLQLHFVLFIYSPRIQEWQTCYSLFTSSNTPKCISIQKWKMHQHYSFKMNGWLTLLKQIRISWSSYTKVHPKLLEIRRDWRCSFENSL